MKLLLTILFFTYSTLSLACPGCAGSVDNPNASNLTYILMGFVVLTYIPFFLIYKTIIKNRKLHEKLHENIQAK